MYLEQGGVMGGALGGIVPTGMSLALIAAQGTWYFVVLCDKCLECIIARLCCTEAVNCRMAE